MLRPKIVVITDGYHIGRYVETAGYLLDGYIVA